MMILLSQAYILRRIWGIKTNNKSYLKCLSKSWTFNLFLKNNFKFFLHEQGIINYLELSNFREKNWEVWMNHFNRYDLSPKVWYSIAPQKWRFKVGEHWKKKKNLTIFRQTDNFSIFSVNSYIEITKKSNKLVENTLLTHKFLDSKKNPITDKFYKLNTKIMDSKNIIINKIHKYPFIDQKSAFLINKKNIFFEHNLLLWFVPEFMEKTNRYRYKKISNLDSSIMKHKNLEIFRNKEFLIDRELNQSIRQWRWKSRNYEKKFKKLGDMASLMTFMQNQETMISLSIKMRKDLNLFRFFFRKNNTFNRLAINSDHRLPRLLDDPILIYKLISTSLKFKQRLKEISDLKNINEYSSDISIYEDRKENVVLMNSFNLENILLPKRRREFRILNSLSLRENKTVGSTEENLNMLEKIQRRNDRVGINKNKIIKRFIWSSYRFEDLACMNRFWFSTMNGSRFSMLRFRMYPIT